MLAQEIADDLQAALAQIQDILGPTHPAEIAPPLPPAEHVRRLVEGLAPRLTAPRPGRINVPMKHVIAHELDDATARKVADRAFAEYKTRYPDYKPTLVWASERRADITFNAKGLKLDGAMLIEVRAIALELDVPFLLRPFQKKAMEIIEREVQVWLAKARAGEF